MTNVWTTKDGQVIPVSSMTDSHLLHAERSLRQSLSNLSRQLTAAEQASTYFRGEMATDQVKADLAKLERTHFLWTDRHISLKSEIRRRGLEPL